MELNMAIEQFLAVQLDAVRHAGVTQMSALAFATQRLAHRAVPTHSSIASAPKGNLWSQFYEQGAAAVCIGQLGVTVEIGGGGRAIPCNKLSGAMEPVRIPRAEQLFTHAPSGGASPTGCRREARHESPHEPLAAGHARYWFRLLQQSSEEMSTLA